MSNDTPTPEPVITEAVDRFLSWPLPRDFGPDCGISFDGRKDDEWNKNKTWPIGTNLFTAEQARAMFEHCLAAPKGPEAQPVAREDCPECKGTGLRDSGGVYPWGEYITTPCDCAAPQAEGTKRSTDGGGQLGEDAGRAASDSRQPARAEQTLPPPPAQQPPASGQEDALDLRTIGDRLIAAERDNERLREAMSDAAISIQVCKGNLGEHTEGRSVLESAERKLRRALAGKEIVDAELVGQLERTRAALREIALGGYAGASYIARRALEGEP